MTYFFDFDRTLFDTNAYNRFLVDHPACAPFKDEMIELLDTPYAVLGSEDPDRKAVWNKVTAVIVSGELTFAPGELSQFLYKDVTETLRGLGNEALIITYGEKERQRVKIESALHDVVRLTVLYTEDKLKADFLSTWSGYYGGPSIFVDDRAKELEGIAEKFPSISLYEMRRDGEKGDGRWPVITSLSQLP